MLELEKLTFDRLVNQATEKYGDDLALSKIKGEGLTYSELGEKVKSISSFLRERGIQKGDRVALIGENQPNWGVAYLAITSMGAVVVPIMTEFSASEVHHIIRHSGSKAVFVSSKLYEKVEDCDYENVHSIVLIDDFSVVPPKTSNDFLKEVIKSGKREFEKIKSAAHRIISKDYDEIKEDDLASIVYTSGTTGHSKGVMLSHKNIIYDAIATLKMVTITPSDRLLSILPLAHTFECTLGFVTPLMAGAKIYYLDRPPTASALIPAMAKVKPTIILSVPLVIEKIYKMRVLPELTKKPIVKTLYKFSPVRKKLHKIAGKKLIKTFGGELRLFPIGGAALAYDVEKFLREAGFPYAIGYGLTETSPVVTGDDNVNTKFRASGRALEGMEIKIDDPDPETGEGEVLIKGPNVMKGYYKDPETTKAVFTEDGWFKSGDLGYIDEEGYLFIRGRSKNVIIGPNGKNIYPEQIEGVINDLPYVLESLVYEKEGKLIAKVHLNYEELDDEFNLHGLPAPEARKKIQSILDSVMKTTNEKVSSFSRISGIVEQPEPFEKTPTKKIKRYLYI